MKKTASLLLALAMVLTLCAPALAASLPTLTYDLSCEGSAAHTLPDGSVENALEYVNTGDEITVYYTISAASETRVGVAQNEIYYDHEFFELVAGSAKAEPTFTDYYVTPQTRYGGGSYFVFFDTITTHTHGEPQRVGSFKLRVIADGGESIISSTSCGAAQNLDKYPITTRNLWVGFGEWSGLTFAVTLDVNGGELPDGVSRVSSVNTEKGETLTLPAPTRLFHTFDYWTDGSAQYAAGQEYAPAAHTTLTAHWTEVPAPAAPTGLGTVKASQPSAADGKITGTSAAMEYSSSMLSRFRPCAGSTVGGLSAGTYYVRYMENEAANQPTGKAAEVKVEAWPLRAAPTGLDVVKASQPGAADGSITGTTAQMEYSRTGDFTDAKSCPNGEMTGLLAGTYSIRFVGDAANNMAASRAATVKVAAWSLRDAPTGLGTVKASEPDASDGRITGTSAQMEYSLTPSFSDAKTCSAGGVSGLSAGTYYVRYVFDSANNMAAGKAATVKVEAWPLRAAPTGLSGFKTSLPNAADGKIIGTTTQMEYSLTPEFTSSVRCPNKEITGLSAGTYYVRFVFDSASNMAASKAAAVVVVAGNAPAAPTNLAAAAASSPSASDGRITGVTAKMEYSAKPDFSGARSCTGSEITGLAAGSYYIRVRADAATNTPAGNYAVVTVPAVPVAPTGLSGFKTSLPNKADGKILGVSTLLEYSAKPDFSDAKTCTGSEITGLAAGTYYVRVKAVPETNTPAGNYALVEVPTGEMPAAPTGLVAVKPTLLGKSDGRITGASSLLEYSTTPDFSDAKACPDGDIEGLAAGKYYFRVKAVPETNTPAGGFVEVEVPAGPAPSGGVPPAGSPAGSNSTDLEIKMTVSEDYVATIEAISDSAIKAAAEGESGVIGINLSMEDDAVESAILPSGMIGKVASAVKANGKGGFALKFTSASIEFDSKALQSLAEQAKSGELQISVLDTGTMGLNDTQTAALSGMSIYGGYNVSAMLGDKSITEFGGGGIRISIPFNIPAGRYSEGFKVYYVAPDGALSALETLYQGGMLSFTVSHFSDYVIVYSEQPVFVDVVPGSFYEKAVTWAVGRGITKGTSDTEFSPDRGTTRAQVVTFLWRAAGEPEPTGSAGGFTDLVPNEYYIKAVAWAVERGITNGTDPGVFSPDTVCTRGQIVTFLARYMNAEKTSAQNPFTDVLPGMYYTDAVMWAVKRGITSGKTPTTFDPDGTCTRAEVVTFLWRCMA